MRLMAYYMSVYEPIRGEQLHTHLSIGYLLTNVSASSIFHTLGWQKLCGFFAKSSEMFAREQGIWF